MCSTGFDARTSVQTLLGIIVTEAQVSSSISTVFPSIVTGTMNALHFPQESETVNMGQSLPFTDCLSSRSSSTNEPFAVSSFFPYFDFGVHFSSHFPVFALSPFSKDTSSQHDQPFDNHGTWNSERNTCPKSN